MVNRNADGSGSFGRWRGALAAAALGAVLVAPVAALADPLHAVLHNAVAQEGSVVLDDATLSDIRGKGAVANDVAAPGANDLAVILWDEQNGRRPQGQQGSGISRSIGFGNVQGHSLVTRRY